MTKDVIIIADYADDTHLSIDEVCEICGVELVVVNDLVAYEIVIPSGSSQQDWVFDMEQLKRLRTALRLQRDLELNLAGIALVLDLLDEMQDLRAHSEILHKHILK